MSDKASWQKSGLENQAEGKTDKTKGRAKDASGGLTGNKSQQAEGKWDKMKGAAKDTFGRSERKVGSDK